MFLSRVELPWEAVRNPYNIHRWLWRLFPGCVGEARASDNEQRQGFLFRVEDTQTGRPARLLVQSRRAPTRADGVLLIGTREFHPQPSHGQSLAFLLTSNPIKTIVDTQREAKTGKQSEKCRVPLIKEEDQRLWLSRKLTGAARVETLAVLSGPPLFFRKGARSGKLITATFEGRLCVEDPVRLTALIANGIGPAKAFGCGLLLVRRT